MYGRRIGSSIIVNSIEEDIPNGIYFLTEVPANIAGTWPKHVDRVWTSVHNACLLCTKLQIDSNSTIVPMAPNERFHIQDQVKKLDFYVTLIDAKQKPGAVMLLFEGEDIGNVLYAGKCCYNDSFFSHPLCRFLKTKVIDCLYVHDGCEDCHNHSVSKTDAVEKAVTIIRKNPKSKIVISEPNFREDILVDLKNRLQKPICVTENIMRHLDATGHGSDFNLDPKRSHVIVTDQPHNQDLLYLGQPVVKIILIPCSMKRTPEEIKSKIAKLGRKGYQNILYRNHCTTTELINMVNEIGAKRTVLIRQSSPRLQVGGNSMRDKDLNFWAHIDYQLISDNLVDFHKEVEMYNSIRLSNNTVTSRDSDKITNKEIITINEKERMNSDIELLLIKRKLSKNEKETHKGSKKSCSEADPSESPIFIGSDKESIASIETVVNTNVVVLS